MPRVAFLLPVSFVITAACADSSSSPRLVHPLDVGGEIAPEDAEAIASAAVADAKTFAGAEVRLEEARVDDLGVLHGRVQQTHDGVPVLGGEAVVHVWPSGALGPVTGGLVQGLDVVTTPTLSAEQAVEVALDAAGARGRSERRPSAESFVRPTADGGRLVWRVRVMDLDNPAGPTIPMLFVDAQSGEVVDAYDDLQTASLEDAAHVTYDMGEGTSYSRAVVGEDSDAELATTHDGAQATMDYLAATFGRDSFDASGALVESYGHYDRSYVNAFWDGSRMTFGDGDGRVSNYLGVLDVVAHEFGHAVTQYEADLVYRNESGALNEASSDILAAVIEASVDGGVSEDTWYVGEDCWLDGDALRFMDRPSDDGSSRDHYSDIYAGSADNGGVHYNSGIANHFFYLLSEGGQHHDPAYRTGEVIEGVGVHTAYAVWYAALTDYMTSGDGFAEARAATEAACEGLGYDDDGICGSVALAWDEVGVVSEVDDPAEPSGSCPADAEAFEGTIDRAGAADFYTYTAAGGVQEITLAGPRFSDLDLYLLRKIGPRGARAAESTSSGADEAISFSGVPGEYIVQVRSVRGAGAYTLCVTTP